MDDIIINEDRKKQPKRKYIPVKRKRQKTCRKCGHKKEWFETKLIRIQ